MKTLFSLFFILGLCLITQGQQFTQEYIEDDFKLIFKKVPRDIVSVIFVIQQGSAKYDKKVEGIESLALKWAVEGGTINYPKKILNQKLESFGTEIGFYIGYDYSLIEMTCLKAHWKESWHIICDILINPSLEKEQFKLAKSRLISDAKYNNQDPNTKLKNLAMANVFGGMNYDRVVEGTSESLTNLSSSQVKKYYSEIIVKSNSFITVVGDLDGDRLKKQVFEKFRALPKGAVAFEVQDFEITQGPSQVHYRNLNTNYIRGYMNAPRLESKDGLSIMLGMKMLNQRIFDVVRIEKGLSYNPRAFFANAVINYPYNVLYLSSSQPAKAVKLMVEVLDKVRRHGFTTEELASQKATYLTNFYLDQETTSSQCNEIVMNELRGGWKERSITPENLSSVEINNINNVIKKYTNAIRWTYLGNKDKISISDLIQPKGYANKAFKK